MFVSEITNTVLLLIISPEVWCVIGKSLTVQTIDIRCIPNSTYIDCNYYVVNKTHFGGFMNLKRHLTELSWNLKFTRDEMISRRKYVVFEKEANICQNVRPKNFRTQCTTQLVNKFIGRSEIKCPIEPQNFTVLAFDTFGLRSDKLQLFYKSGTFFTLNATIYGIVNETRFSIGYLSSKTKIIVV